VRERKKEIADTRYFALRVAANPSDPANEKGSDAATGGMSSEDRELSNSVARSVMRITHGILDWEPKEAVRVYPLMFFPLSPSPSLPLHPFAFLSFVFARNFAILFLPFSLSITIRLARN
jgi:hypothetical protein